jgi:hypothetical protein
MEHILWAVEWDGECPQDVFTTLQDAEEFALKRIKAEQSSEDYELMVKDIEKSYNEQRGFYIDGYVYCYHVKLHD